MTFNSYKRTASTAQNFLYNQGYGDTKFATERVFELGIDMTKRRVYDYAIGRFWQIDPLSDEGGQENLTPYQYSFNNPILYNDPLGEMGQCPGGCDKFIKAATDDRVVSKARSTRMSAKKSIKMEVGVGLGVGASMGVNNSKMGAGITVAESKVTINGDGSTEGSFTTLEANATGLQEGNGVEAILTAGQVTVDDSGNTSGTGLDLTVEGKENTDIIAKASATLGVISASVEVNFNAAVEAVEGYVETAGAFFGALVDNIMNPSFEDEDLD